MTCLDYWSWKGGGYYIALRPAQVFDGTRKGRVIRRPFLRVACKWRRQVNEVPYVTSSALLSMNFFAAREDFLRGGD